MKNLKLARAILEDGRTQTAIAKAAGLHFVTVCLAVNGRRTPRVETAARLARVLGRKASEIGLIDIDSVLREGGEG